MWICSKVVSMYWVFSDITCGVVLCSTCMCNRIYFVNKQHELSFSINKNSKLFETNILICPFHSNLDGILTTFTTELIEINSSIYEMNVCI